jgi:type I restriction enzyme, S subunit
VSAILKAREPNARYLAALRPPLVEHFELVASAPGDVARLRELILTLAVRGKLVSQDANEEPACALLARAGIEKKRRIAEGSIRPDRQRRDIDEDEPLADLPVGWEWVRLADVVRILNGRAYSKQELLERGSTPVLRVGNLFTSNHWYYSNLELDADKYCHPGDLLYAWSASFGPFIWNGPKAIFHYHIWKLDPITPDLFEPRYLHTFLQEKTAEIKAAGHGVSMIHMTKEKMQQIAVPYPPLAEQARIVARVEELMRLCGALEDKGRLEAAQQAQLVDALLATLTDSASPEELAANWQRVADHFDLLLDRPEAVDAVEQAILQLAVSGLLEAQHLTDESAAALLSRIRRSRRSRRKLVAPDREVVANSGHRLPPGWTWASADELSADSETAITDGPFGANLKTEHYVDSSGFRVVRLQNIGAGVFRHEHHAYISRERFEQLKKHRVFEGDIVVAGLVDESLRCCIVPPNLGPAIVKADCYRLAVHEAISSEFVCLYLSSKAAHEFASVHHHGLTLTRIGLGNFRSLPVPLPPVEEQHRIVTRVNQLRRLCADLREKLANGQATRARLADALVEAAVSPD